ncbi:50S ribosomal protein L4 [Trichlorobacter ammonificans]|uniref:Large ribosomal subunit protein uL4 n=1 Tax=Trichlorobacter ammonificans TaxID=2916410 RepID=A0ABN8HCS1_9BACT|nr:50S ribosomal protein L4 [Trichlorobacter ammonificans]CAH2030579.1 50S ribosomal protein L4 [Trichlorobacter ammonificans]
MPTISMYNMQNEKVGEISLDEAVFAAEVKEPLIHQALKIQLANRRAGTVSTKNRSEVAGSGKKPFKQKGTGGARQGCKRAPQYPGGGIVFGPQPKTYQLSITKKARKAALRSLLSLQLKRDRITVLDNLEFSAISTKEFAGFLKRFDLDRSLIITEEPSTNLYLSSRNVPYVKLLKADSLNVYDVLKYRNIILTKGAVPLVEGALQQ